jgi:hypothetical protein
MGDNGKNAFAKTYNWHSEEKKLLAFYQKALKK